MIQEVNLISLAPSHLDHLHPNVCRSLQYFLARSWHYAFSMSSVLPKPSSSTLINLTDLDSFSRFFSFCRFVRLGHSVASCSLQFLCQVHWQPSSAGVDESATFSCFLRAEAIALDESSLHHMGVS